MSIFDFQSVMRCDITVVDLDRKSFAVRPIQQFPSRAFVGQNPENFCCPSVFQLCEQSFQIFKTGNARHFFTSQQSPHDDHQTAIPDRQVGREHCPPIRLVVTQPSETGPGWGDEKTTMPNHRGDRFINIAVEEPDAENLAGRSH